MLPRLEDPSPLCNEHSHLTSRGRVIGMRGPVISATLPCAGIGELVSIAAPHGALSPIPALVVGFDRAEVKLLPLRHADHLRQNAVVESLGSSASLNLEGEPLGAVIDALGTPLSPSAAGTRTTPRPLSYSATPPPALTRLPLTTPFRSGISTIDGLLPLAHGQRIGLFAAAGVGKSTLLGMLARAADVDVVVVGLIGERGREVTEFLSHALGEQGRRRSVVVCATSDEPPAKRMLAASTATAIAESYRSEGKRVLLLIDSLTRVARAIREVGLCMGELPVRHGYTPSVYTELPRLLERAGNDHRGSITALYTVLSNAEEDVDPLAEEIISLLDGHIHLTQKMIVRGVRPAIDPTKSLSRVASSLLDRSDFEDTQLIIRSLARLWKEKDLLLLGGTPDEELKKLLAMEGELMAILSERQDASQALEVQRSRIRKTARALRGESDEQSVAR